MLFSGIHLVAMVCLITVVLLTLTKLLDWGSSFYSAQVDAEIASDRFHSIDGLRGFLAIGVMFHHCVINYYRYQTGRWEAPPSTLALMFGQVGVAMFFMVTAFLFWNRALRQEGRLDIRRFYWSRMMRMCPMYFVAALLLIWTAVWMCSYNLNVPLWLLGRQTVSWLSFTALGTPEVNGVHDTGLINTVFWSLLYEWRFYLAFPILTLFAKGRVAWVAWLLCLTLVWMFSATNYEWYFVYGALAALINFHFPLIKRLCRSPVAAVIVVLMLFATEQLTKSAYTPKAAVMLFLAFLIIANGNTLFGILTARPARILGAMSYSIYLLHNWVISAGSRIVNEHIDVSSLTPLQYWGLAAGFAVVTVLISATTYRLIEFPFLKAKMPSWIARDNAPTTKATAEFA